MPEEVKIQDLSNPDYIPTGVKDVKAYKEFIELSEKLNDEKRFYQTSDPEIKIDLCATPYIIKRKVGHLSSEEYDQIVELTHPWRKLLGDIGTLKRKAYGILYKSNNDSHLGVLAIKETEILEYFGKFYSLEELFKIVNIDWGYNLAISHLKLFYRKHIEKIKELQEAYKADVTDIRLHHKRSRLDEYQMMFNKRKQKYEQDESIANEKQLQSLLESVKKEVEGDLVIQGKYQIEIEEKIHYQVEQELLKDFNVTAVVISKLAAKLGINPMFLLTRLAQSRYAKFAGFAQGEAVDAEIVHPSELSYDMTKIAQLAKKGEVEDKKMKALPILESKDKETAINIKRKLLDELQTKEKIIIKTRSNIERGLKDE